jgi:hypothetical protein
MRPRLSPEMDDGYRSGAEEYRTQASGMRAEEVIVQQLAPHIIPAMNRVPDPRLASNADQSWFQ